MFSLNIKQRLKMLETITNQDTNHSTPILIDFITEPNEDIYKLDTSQDQELFINIADADKLEFKSEQECIEWLDANRQLINLPNNYTDKDRAKIKPMVFKITDNSHLERVMYEHRNDKEVNYG